MSEKLTKKLNDKISSNKTAIEFIEKEIPKQDETINEFTQIVEKHKRCDSLSNDSATIKELTISLCQSFNSSYEYVCVILPTAPFTLPKHIVDAAKNIEINIPLVVRLAGTNFSEGKKILDNSGLKLISAENLDDAAKKIVEAVK